MPLKQPRYKTEKPGRINVAMKFALKVARLMAEEHERDVMRRYVPYGLEDNEIQKGITWQYDFHQAGNDYVQRFICAANQIGKTYIAIMEDAYHATGRYPSWWQGKRYDKPVLIWVCGVSNEKVRDSLQEMLLGDPSDPGKWGTGAIPYKCLEIDSGGAVKTASKQNVPNGVSYFRVRHITGGWSRIMFKSYEMKKKGFMTQKVDVIHLDEEPPMDIMGSCVVRMVNNDGIMYMPFTPENGMTEVVSQIFNDLQPSQMLITASWADAPHMTEARKKEILAMVPAHERGMRSKGIPMPGDGLIFPVSDEEIGCAAFKIPDHYKRLIGLDFGGWNHPTAAVWIAWDEDSGNVYVTDTYKAKERSPASHCQAVRRAGDHIPIIYPHDAEKADRKSGISMAQEWRDLGANMHTTHFTNPPALGQKPGSGGNSPMAGLVHIYELMLSGKFKVFSHLEDWFKEKRMYHTQGGKLVRINEDLMSATRMAVMMRDRAGEAQFKSYPRSSMAKGDWDIYDNN